MKKPLFKFHHRFFQSRTYPALLILVSLVLFSCVSVQIPGSGSAHAPKVDFSEPSSPFKKEKTDSADRAWQSKETSNTIAYFSDCSQSADRDLKEIANDALAALTDPKILDSKENFTFDGREAVNWIATGKVDGVQVNIWLVVFKKNGCNFTLSLLGAAKRFDEDKTQFENFTKSFQVPAW